MVSKTRAQRQKKKELMEQNGGHLPATTPTPRKSVHDKKTRPNMKAKQKIRLGMTSADIYEGFEERSTQGTNWTCPTCHRQCRTVGFCVGCNAAGKEKTEEYQLQQVANQQKMKLATTTASAKKATKSSSGPKKKAAQRPSSSNKK